MPQGLSSVVPNGVIESAWHNSVADRVTGRFANATERNAAIPAPSPGQLCWTGFVLTVYTGGGSWSAVVAPAGLAGRIVWAAPTDLTSTTDINFGPILNFTAPAWATTFVGTLLPATMLQGAGGADGHFTIRAMLNVTTPGSVTDMYVTSISSNYVSATMPVSMPIVGSSVNTLRLQGRRVSGTGALRFNGYAVLSGTFLSATAPIT